MKDTLVNFSFGYATDLSAETMEPGMLLTAENCVWDGRLRKRGGSTTWSSLGSYADCWGFVKVRQGTTWYTIAALQVSSQVNFYWSSNGNAWTKIGTENWTATHVRFAVMRDKIMAVNGVAFPVILYYSSGWTVQDADSYDVRTRATTDWVAGQYTASGPTYTDDTTDAQDAGADDFQLVSATNNDGFYVGCNFTFDKIALAGVDSFAGSPVGKMLYYKGSGVWNSQALTATPGWTGGGSISLQISTIPTDWEAWDSSTESTLIGKYVLRYAFTTAPTSAAFCASMAVSHNSYLRQLLNGQMPNLVLLHNSCFWIFENVNAWYSSPNLPSGWEMWQAEYFVEGGPVIRDAVSLSNILTVLKDDAVHGFFGNQFESGVKRKISDDGAAYAGTAVAIGSFVYFLGTDGYIRRFDGTENVRISKHINSDISGFTKTGVTACQYRGRYWISFPASSTILVFDPDTFRRDEEGDGRVSFYKFTGIKVDYFGWWGGAAQTLYGVDRTNKRIVALDNTAIGYDISTTATIDMKVKTQRLLLADSPQSRIDPQRMRIDVLKAGNYTVLQEADDGVRTAGSYTCPSGTYSASLHYEEELGFVYTMSGRDLAIQVRNNTKNPATLFAIVLEYDKRRF